MSNVENDRQIEILTVFDDNRLPRIGSLNGQNSTNVDLKVDGFRYLLVELIDELGSTKSEPYDSEPGQMVTDQLKLSSVFTSKASVEANNNQFFSLSPLPESGQTFLRIGVMVFMLKFDGTLPSTMTPASLTRIRPWCTLVLKDPLFSMNITTID